MSSLLLASSTPFEFSPEIFKAWWQFYLTVFIVMIGVGVVIDVFGAK